MSVFTLAIFSCLTTFNVPRFMDLIFHVPMQNYSLQHQTLLPPPVTSTAGHCFCFGFISSFFLELFLHSFQVAYWAPTNLGSSSFSILSFCLFVLFLGFSRQEYWSGFPFPSPVDHILWKLSTMTHPSWVTLRGMAHNFIELGKVVLYVISLISFLCCGFHPVCLLIRIRGFCKLPDGRDWLWGKLGFVLMVMVMLSKSLIQFLLMDGAVFLLVVWPERKLWWR